MGDKPWSENGDKCWMGGIGKIFTGWGDPPVPPPEKNPVGYPNFAILLMYTTGLVHNNPITLWNLTKFQKTIKHAAWGVAQSPYPIYRYGKACFSKQPPWLAAGDPRLARGRSCFFSPPSLPSSFRRYFFVAHSPPTPQFAAKVLGFK